MSNYEVAFQLFALLLGLSMAELFAGLARTWRIKAGAVAGGEVDIDVGWLVPLFGLLLLLDQTRFWITAYTLRDYFVFDYAHLLALMIIIGGYFVISTFVFPDEPSRWPDFDDYFLRTNRTVVGGMIVINVAIFAHAALLAAGGAPWRDVPMARSWLSIGAAAIYLPALIALWFAKSRRANLLLLLFLNAVFVAAAIGSIDL